MEPFLVAAQRNIRKAVNLQILVRSYQTSKSLSSKSLCRCQLKSFSEGWGDMVKQAVDVEPELYNGSLNIIVKGMFFWGCFNCWIGVVDAITKCSDVVRPSIFKRIFIVKNDLTLLSLENQANSQNSSLIIFLVVCYHCLIVLYCLG